MHTRHEGDQPTPTIENYLKAIRSLEGEDRLVRPKEIAKAVGVAAPTVTVTLRRVEQAGWIERVDRKVRLTTSGREHASSVTHRRDVGLAFLEQVLGLPHADAAAQACDLEHALSSQAVDALERRLAQLTHCAGRCGVSIPTHARSTS